MLNLGSNVENELDFKYTLVLQVRDGKGNATGKTRKYSTNDAALLAQFFESNVYKKRRKKKVDKKEQISGQEAEQILNNLYSAKSETDN